MIFMMVLLCTYPNVCTLMEPEDKQRAEMDEEALQPGLPEGAMFMRQLSSSAIFFIESSNPFRKCKVFDISQTNQVALTVERVPRGYRPYPGCMFVRNHDICIVFILGINFVFQTQINEYIHYVNICRLLHFT